MQSVSTGREDRGAEGVRVEGLTHLPLPNGGEVMDGAAALGWLRDELAGWIDLASRVAGEARQEECDALGVVLIDVERVVEACAAAAAGEGPVRFERDERSGDGAGQVVRDLAQLVSAGVQFAHDGDGRWQDAVDALAAELVARTRAARG